MVKSCHLAQLTVNNAKIESQDDAVRSCHLAHLTINPARIESQDDAVAKRNEQLHEPT